MTKRELEQMIDERADELIRALGENTYKENEEYDEILREKREKFYVDLEALEKKHGLVCDNYHRRNLLYNRTCIPEYNDLVSKNEIKKSEIKKEAKQLKVKLVIMGLKNPAVAEILTKYLGLEA